MFYSVPQNEHNLRNYGPWISKQAEVKTNFYTAKKQDYQQGPIITISLVGLRRS